MAIFLKIYFCYLLELIGPTEGPKGVIRIQEVPIPYVRCIRRGRDGPDSLVIDNWTISCN